MTGYLDKYKIKIGKYRLGITIDKTQKKNYGMNEILL